MSYLRFKGMRFFKSINTEEKALMVNTDAGKGFISMDVKDYHHDYRVMDPHGEKIDAWSPWVHRFISNAN